MRICKKLCCLLLVLGTVCTGCAEKTTTKIDLNSKTCIQVDFSKFTGIPLFKRQNVFSPSHSFVGSYAAEFLRDAPLLRALRSENQRVDLFMGNGGIGGTIGLGSPDAITHSFMTLDAMLKIFYKNGSLPYLVYFATPNALYDKQAAGSSYWKYPPVDMEKWGEVCGDIAAHYKELGWPMAAHEIWNEPDWFDHSVNDMAFYGGTWDEYIQIYDAAARGIRAQNPYAMVGGLSLATFDTYYSNGNVKQFLSHVQENRLPLDFISYHCYVPNNYKTYTELANQALSGFGDTFAGTGLHMNEFHISLSSGTTATEKCIAPMLDAISYFVETPQVTSVNWACFRVSGEQGIQMIESRTGKRYAAYHLLAFYNNMPVDRVYLKEANGIQGFASIDGDRAGVLLYNRTYKAKDYTLALQELPFDTCDITIYAIDEQHSNHGKNGGSDEADIIYSAQDVATADLGYQASLPSGGMIYVDIQKNGTTVELPDVTAFVDDQVIHGGVATVLRREYYFEDRNSTMFSEFDLGSFSAWAGMGDAGKGLSKGTVVLTNLPEALIAMPRLSGAQSAGATCFLYAEYVDGQGQTVAQQLFAAGGNLDNLPQALQTESMEALPLDGTFSLRTPEGFTGALHLTYGVMDAGADTTLKISFDKE